MHSETFDLVTVASGARSLRSREHGETFHPVVGPMAEARALHVAQQRMPERAAASTGSFVVWDVGLGAAANAVAVLEAFAQQPGGRVELHSFDHTLAPLRFALAHADELEYLAPYAGVAEVLAARGRVEIGGLTWHLHLGDFRTLPPAAPAPHAVLYDPYSPRSNPALWTLEHFTALRRCVGLSCLLSNYTRSTAVRVTLLLAGFYVGRGGATGEKDETTLAATDPALLARPLGTDWLQRVQRSTRGAPLRSGQPGGGIADEHWQRLRAHPQFASLP